MLASCELFRERTVHGIPVVSRCKNAKTEHDGLNGNFTNKFHNVRRIETSVTNCSPFLPNRPRSIYHYSNIAPRLSGQNCKFLSFFCLKIPKRDLDTKKTTPNIEVRPESLGDMLEY